MKRYIKSQTKYEAEAYAICDSKIEQAFDDMGIDFHVENGKVRFVAEGVNVSIPLNSLYDVAMYDGGRNGNTVYNLVQYIQKRIDMEIQLQQ